MEFKVQTFFLKWTDLQNRAQNQLKIFVNCFEMLRQLLPKVIQPLVEMVIKLKFQVIMRQSKLEELKEKNDFNFLSE